MNTLNPLYTEQSREALAILNEAAAIAFRYSADVGEKHSAMLKQNAARVAAAMDPQQWKNPEAALSAQRQSGAEMLNELHKFGAEFCALTDAAGKQSAEVAAKWRAFAEQSADAAAKQASENFSVDQEIVYPSVVRQTARTFGDLCESGVKSAAEAARSGAEAVLSGQKAAAEQVASGAAGVAAAAAGATGGKRKKRS